MADDLSGTVQTVMTRLDIEGTNATAKVYQYVNEARGFLDEQKQKAGIDVTTNPTQREVQLIENYAEGRYVMSNTKAHSETLFNAARTDIRVHVSAIISNKTEDEVATGTNQFKFSSGGVRDGNGL